MARGGRGLGHRARGAARDRHHEPARDDGPVGPQDRRPRLPRDRLAEPPDGRVCARLQGRGPRARLPRAHRPRPRPVLLRQQDRAGSSRATPRCGRAPRPARSRSARSTRWLIHRLTGGRVHATDPTNASRTLLFDIHAPPLGPRAPARSSACPRPMLPEVRPSCRRLRRDGGARRASRRGPDRRGSPATSRPRSSARAASSRAWRRTPTAPAPSSCSTPASAG